MFEVLMVLSIQNYDTYNVTSQMMSKIECDKVQNHYYAKKKKRIYIDYNVECIDINEIKKDDK